MFVIILSWSKEQEEETNESENVLFSSTFLLFSNNIEKQTKVAHPTYFSCLGHCGLSSWPVVDAWVRQQEQEQHQHGQQVRGPDQGLTRQ